MLKKKKAGTEKVIGRIGIDAPNSPIPQFDGTIDEKQSDEKAES